MAVALPALISVASGSFGAAVGTLAAGGAGLGATLGAFATVAGTVLTGIGALTGKKDLLKIGGILSLGAGLASLASNAAGSTSSLATDAASSGAESAIAPTQFGGDMSFLAGGDPLASGAIGGFNAGSTAGLQGLGTGGQAIGFGDVIGNGGLGDAATAGGAATGAGSLAQTVAQTGMPGGNALTLDTGSIMGNALKNMNPNMLGQATDAAGAMTQPSMLQQIAGSSVTQGDIGSYLQKAWERTQGVLKNTGQFLKGNKELAMLGGMALNSMYGPQAEALDQQKSLMARARRNLNAPIALKFGTQVGG